MANGMNSYELSRAWFDFTFDNPDKIKPIHVAIYFFAIEHCNRLGWKKKFGFPTSMVLEATGIKSYSSYKKHFDEIVVFGFFKVHEYSKNQFSSNVIELTLNVKASAKALDKALSNHLQKQSTKHSQSTVSIDKQLNNITTKQLNNDIESRKLKFASTIKEFKDDYPDEMRKAFYDYWTEPNKSNTKFRMELQKTWSLERRLKTWANNDKTFNNGNSETKPNRGDAKMEAYRQFLES